MPLTAANNSRFHWPRATRSAGSAIESPRKRTVLPEGSTKRFPFTEIRGSGSTLGDGAGSAEATLTANRPTTNAAAEILFIVRGISGGVPWGTGEAYLLHANCPKTSLFQRGALAPWIAIDTARES